MPHVFVSYVREDSEQVERLGNDLTKHGVEVWLDKDDIKPGARWKDAIRSAIQDGDYFIACFSINYVNRASKAKTYMNEELQLALDELRQYGPNRAWFIPVLLSECTVPALSISSRETLLDIQWVNLYHNWHDGIKRILNVIKPLHPDVLALMHSLASADHSIRTLALSGLEEIADPRTILSISSLLPDKQLGKDAADVIGKIGDESAIPLLVNFIASTAPETTMLPPPKDNWEHDNYCSIKRLRYPRTARAHAIEALCDIADRAATNFLLDVLRDSEFNVSLAAAEALGKMGDPAAVPTLVKCLEDPDEDVRSNAAIALGGIADARAVSPLINLLSNRQSTLQNRLDAVAALGRIGDPGAVPALVECLSALGQNGIYVVAQALKNIGGNKALPFLFEDLGSGNSEICGRALYVLERIGNPEAIPILINTLKNPAATVDIRALGGAIRSCSDVSIVPSVLEALKGSEAIVRRRAPFTLSLLCEDALSRVRSGEINEIPSVCLAVQPALIDALSDRDPEARARAAEGLRIIEYSYEPRRGLTEREHVFQALARSLELESDERVQRILATALRTFDYGDERLALKGSRSEQIYAPLWEDWTVFVEEPPRSPSSRRFKYSRRGASDA